MKKGIGFVVLVFSVCFALVLFYLQPHSENSIIKPNVEEPVITSQPIPQLTLDTIFDEDVPKISDDLITLVVTGDVLPARSVNFKTVQQNDFLWAYAPTADLLRSGDITFINLETPLIDNCPLTNEGMRFCGDRRHIQGLTHAGVDVANLANNHAGNYGKEGVDATKQLLQNAGIVAVGALNNPQYMTVKGVTFAFLGYDDIEPQPGVSKVDVAVMKQEIAEARSNADVVVVQLHWGVEYVSQPSDRQRELAKAVIDAGADFVIGNHPHWIQPVEIYNGKLITYAHGNFIFDQMWSQKTKEGVVGTYYFKKNKLVDARYTPIEIVDYGQARIIVDQQHKDAILHYLRTESEQLASNSH